MAVPVTDSPDAACESLLDKLRGAAACSSLVWGMCSRRSRKQPLTPALLLQDLDMAVPATDSPDAARESALDKLRRVAEGLEEELFVAEAMRHEAEVGLLEAVERLLPWGRIIACLIYNSMVLIASPVLQTQPVGAGMQATKGPPYVVPKAQLVL